MILQKDTLNQLRERFKLNIYEVKIWTSLLSRGIAAASELADISGVPRSRCYDVLESLEKKGFIIMKVGKPIKYIAVQPEAVVDRVKKKLMEEAEHQIEIVNKLEKTDIFEELELLHKTGIKKINIESITDSVVGRLNINRFLKGMLMRANKSVTIVTDQKGLKNKLKVLKKSRSALSRKKIHVKLYTNDPKNVSTELGFVEILNTHHDVRFVNVDNEEVMFVMAGKDPEYDTAVWIKSPFLVAALNGLFEKSLK
jgi:sugar-specific transcriptional regulator TrmB